VVNSLRRACSPEENPENATASRAWTVGATSGNSSSVPPIGHGHAPSRPPGRTSARTVRRAAVPSQATAVLVAGPTSPTHRCRARSRSTTAARRPRGAWWSTPADSRRLQTRWFAAEKTRLMIGSVGGGHAVTAALAPQTPDGRETEIEVVAACEGPMGSGSRGPIPMCCASGRSSPPTTSRTTGSGRTFRPRGCDAAPHATALVPPR